MGRGRCCPHRRSARITSRASRSGARTSGADTSRCARLYRRCGRRSARRRSESGRKQGRGSSTPSRRDLRIGGQRGEGQAARRRGRRGKDGGRRSPMGGRGRGARTSCCRRVRVGSFVVSPGGRVLVSCAHDCLPISNRLHHWPHRRTQRVAAAAGACAEHATPRASSSPG